MKLKVLIIICCCILVQFFNGCVRYNVNFPYVSFERNYDLLLISNYDLQFLCGSVVDTSVGAGYGGIVIFRQAYEGLPNDCISFDLACTNEDCSHTNSVKVEPYDIWATCPVCGRQYDLMNYGWPTNVKNTDNKKNNPLMQYETNYYGRYVFVKN